MMKSCTQGRRKPVQIAFACCVGLFLCSQEASGAFIATLDSVTKNGSSYITVQVQNTDLKNQFGPSSVIAGQLNWTAAEVVPGVSGPGNTFGTFCIEIPRHVNFGNDYTFTSTPLGNLPTSRNPLMGDLKAAQIQALWAAWYSSIIVPDDSQKTAKNYAAFQTAIWETVYEQDSTYDVGNGNFLASNSSSVTTLANSYLATISGSYLDNGVLKSADGTTALARANVVGFAVTKGGTDAQDQITEAIPSPAPSSLILALSGCAPAWLLRRRIRKSSGA